MISACYARLASSFSVIRLQLVLNSQINAKDCLKWGKNINTSQLVKDIESVKPILERLSNEPDFMVREIYLNTLKISILNFTSYIEFFLKDSLALCMKRNYSLLNKGLSDEGVSITPKDITEFQDIIQIREKYIYLISDYKCKGELWSNKFKCFINFLSLPKSLLSNEINIKMDSFWRLRNDIVHGNSKVYNLKIKKEEFIYSSDMSNNEYIQFIKMFIDLMDSTLIFFQKVDSMYLELWPATDGELLQKSSE
jgi:hypothetical protein